MCKLLKNDKKLLPFKEVEATLRKFQELIQLEKIGGENKSRISEFCISYAENQFGDRQHQNRMMEGFSLYHMICHHTPTIEKRSHFSFV
jgi:hypothetical protein